MTKKNPGSHPRDGDGVGNGGRGSGTAVSGISGWPGASGARGEAQRAFCASSATQKKLFCNSQSGWKIGGEKKKKLGLLFQLPFPGFFSLLLRSRREFQHRDFGDGGREALRSKSSWSVPEKGGKNAGLSQRIPKIPGFRSWRYLGIKIFPNQAPNYPELSQTSSSLADFGSWHHLGIQIFPNRAPQPQKRERKKLDYPKAFPKQPGLAPGPI